MIWKDMTYKNTYRDDIYIPLEYTPDDIKIGNAGTNCVSFISGIDIISYHLYNILDSKFIPNTE